MDGGRILRAWLARKRDYVRATELAVRTGRVVAAGMIAISILLSFVTQTLCVLPLIALFVWYAGGRELMAVRLRHGLAPFGGGPPAGFRAQAAEAQAQPPGTGNPEPRGSHGFSEQEVRDLERYRGRLPRPPQSEP